MKKILIITFYWPPSGGSGVQRWLYMSKHLANMGYKVYIYTPENAVFQSYDYSLINDISDKLIIIKKKIKDPWYYFNKFFGKKIEIGQGFTIKSTVKNSFLKNIILKISLFIRANFIIPDPRVFWVKPSIRFLKKYIKNENIDVVITTGPPHSMHLIGLKLKKKLNIQWIADFRDPMSNIDFIDELNPSKFSLYIIKKLEKEIFKNADILVTVSKNWANDFMNIYERNIVVIENGYEMESYSKINEQIKINKFCLTHTGTLPYSRNPHSLWVALNKLIKENPYDFRNNLKIVLPGIVDDRVINEIDNFELRSFTEIPGNLPHNEAIKIQLTSSILILPINNVGNFKGILTGKIYEYIASRRPILAIGPLNGEISSILKETKSGQLFDYKDIEGIYNFILKKYEEYMTSGIKFNNIANIYKYSRKFMAYKYSKIIESYL